MTHIDHSTTSDDSPVALFISYSHADEPSKVMLDKHLAMLRRNGVIDSWHDRMIGAGNDWKSEIDSHLESADVVLLLLSPDYLDSRFCYDIETAKALEKHNRGDGCVIPIIVRPCEWLESPLARFQALPRDGKPISTWDNLDNAYLDIARGIRDAVKRLQHPQIPCDTDLTTPPTSSLGSTLVIAPPMEVEIRIDRDFDGWSTDDSESLLSGIRHFLNAGAEVKLVKVKRGSVRVTLSLPSDQAHRLAQAIDDGLLAELDIVDAVIKSGGSTRIPLNRASERFEGLRDKLELSTAEIGLAVRTTNLLEERGVFTVNDLLHCGREDLLSISNFGEKTLEEVYRALENIGFYRSNRG